MPERSYSYIIIGGGLAGAASIEGIRQHDTAGSILLISAEHDPPYDRPPLSKKLWTGGKRVEEIFLHPQSFYTQHGVELKLSPTGRSRTRLASSITSMKAVAYAEQ